MKLKIKFHETIKNRVGKSIQNINNSKNAFHKTFYNKESTN